MDRIFRNKLTINFYYILVILLYTLMVATLLGGFLFSNIYLK